MKTERGQKASEQGEYSSAEDRTDPAFAGIRDHQRRLQADEVRRARQKL